MGIVKISDSMHENIRSASNAFSRSINSQAEHWLRVGMLAEMHPQLSYTDICRLLLQIEQSGGEVGNALKPAGGDVASVISLKRTV
ncbi:ParD-like family protein [Methylobacillus sp. Pita2]|uniref:ParD-like family protein n=1 Tax=Methylobacillus TaxID=404 RepID=UPI002853DC4A|nr:ParD-like family protein [Methylobacillus flagellatus]MDR5172952.1 ParD-like family protein [Methylobacillus flagellatus]